MKKLTTLLLAAGLVVSSFAGASAAEFKPSAQFINQYTFGTSGDNWMTGVKDLPSSQLQNRIQLGFDYIASENLSGTFLVRVGQNEYGSGEFDSAWGANNGNGKGIAVRLAYVDWMIPSTDVSVRMGYQPVALPAFAFGSAVLDARGSGITITAPINENMAVTALWTRFSNANYGDVFSVVGDFNFDGFRVAPWVAYVSADRGVTGTPDFTFPWNYTYTDTNGLYSETESAKSQMWFVGASVEVSMFDPFTFALDAYYSRVSLKDGVYSETNYGVINTEYYDEDASGFFIGASASYKLPYATPSLKAWYASGEDEANNGDFMGAAYLAPCFAATTIMFDNYLVGDDYVEKANGASPSGTWGIMLDVSDISFIENLSHQFVVAYIQGTNEANNGAGDSLSNMGKDDSAIEINFNSTYQIYKNLSTTLQLAWLAPNFEAATSANGYNDDIMRAAIAFVYNF